MDVQVLVKLRVDGLVVDSQALAFRAVLVEALTAVEIIVILSRVTQTYSLVYRIQINVLD